MINPKTITNFNRTEEELEEFLLFAILVAGKSAKQQAKKLDLFLKQQQYANTISERYNRKWTPFDELQLQITNDYLDDNMRKFKLGQYKRIGHAFHEILKFKGRLSQVTLEELESVKGIGSKTARFFILHSRPDAKVAVLDTHLLAHMRDMGIDAPKQTPSKKKYLELEKKLLEIIEQSGKTFAEYDLDVWKAKSKT